MPKRARGAGKPLKRVNGTDDAAAPSAPARRAIVVCGASAGGLEAFSQLLAALPARVNAAFVIVPHLAPEHASMMSQLLQHQTTLSVAEAVDGAPLEAGHVHVAPPGMTVAVRDGQLHLMPRPDGGAFH